MDDRIPDPSRWSNPESKSDYDADSAIVEALLAQLPIAMQLVVRLRYTFDLSIAQTAAVTGKTEGNVKALSHKGLANMRKFYMRDQESVMG